VLGAAKKSQEIPDKIIVEGNKDAWEEEVKSGEDSDKSKSGEDDDKKELSVHEEAEEEEAQAEVDP
jgi:hypothetical protein